MRVYSGAQKHPLGGERDPSAGGPGREAETREHVEPRADAGTVQQLRLLCRPERVFPRRLRRFGAATRQCWFDAELLVVAKPAAQAQVVRLLAPREVPRQRSRSEKTLLHLPQPK